MNKKDFDEIMEYCYKNNTIPLKDSNLRLAILDGGWVNVMKFQRFLEGKLKKDEETK